MNKKVTDPAAFSKYIRLLGNPYAKQQMQDEEEPELEFEALSDTQRTYVHRQENQYAKLSIAVRVDQEASIVSLAPQDRASKTSVPKKYFREECRRIFGQYIPEFEKGSIRDEHRSFITRNENQPPHVRYGLLRELQKYDLTGTGIRARFNREREELTDKKLKQIEDVVLNSQK